MDISILENTSDVISRQAAIDALNEYFARILKMKRGGLREKAISLDTVGAIKALPPVQPKHGKWIDAVIPNDNGDLLVQVCDQCNTFFPLAYTGGGHHFCPNCGADMRGEAE